MNIFKQFFKSLYSPRDISLFRFQGIGKTIVYVFFLTLLSIIPIIYYSSSAFIYGIGALQSSLETELPAFEISNGELHSDAKAPVIINKDHFTVILDSTGTIDQTKIAESENTVAILKHSAFFISGGHVQSFPYTMINDLKLSHNDLLDLIASVNSSTAVFIPLFALVIYIFSAGLKFIEISILALIGLFVKNMLKRNIYYRHTWRIAAYSVTLPTVFFMIMDSLQTKVLDGILVNWFVSFIIIFLSIKEVPASKHKQ